MLTHHANRTQALPSLPGEQGAIRWTRFASVTDTRGTEQGATWEAFAEMLRTSPPRAASKQALPLLKLATFNGPRSSATVAEVFGLEGDHDGGTMSAGEAIQRLERHGIRAVVYSTPSSTAERPRWRVLAPLARPHLPAERARLVARLNGALGGVLAAESFTLGQVFYFGAVEGVPYTCIQTFDEPDEGSFIDGLHELDEIAVWPTGKASQEPSPPVVATAEAGTVYLPPGTVADLRDALSRIPSDDRDLWVRFCLALRPCGQQGWDLWDEWSRKSAKYDPVDAARVWHTAKPRGEVNYESIFAVAAQHGWTNPLAGGAVQASSAPPLRETDAEELAKVSGAIEAIPADAELVGDNGRGHPAPKLIGYALRTWAGTDAARIAAARQACAQWDARHDAPAGAVWAFDAGKLNAPNPLTVASIYRLAGEHGWDAGVADASDRAALLELAQRRLSPDLGEHMPPYPVEALGPLADVCEAVAQGTQTDRAIVGNGLLAAAALLASGLFDVEGLGTGVRPTSLFSLTVAVSGSGKDTSDRVTMGAVYRWQQRANDAYNEAMRDFETALSARKKGEPMPEAPTAPHRVCADMTVEGLRKSFSVGVPAQGVFSTEAAAVLAGYGFSADHRAKTAGNLCGLWDRGHLSVVRATGGRFEKYELRLNAHLAVQPAAVQEALNDPLLAQIGLWPRFLLAWPPSPQPRRYRAWRPEDDAVVRRWWARCEELLALPLPSGDRVALRLSDEARQVLADFFETCERRAARGGDLWDVRPFALRATEQANRIAGVLAAVKGHAVVGADDARCGVELARYSVEGWRIALDRRVRDKAADNAMALLRWLLDRPGARASNTEIIRQGPRALRSAEARDAAVARLVEANMVQVRDGTVAVAGDSPSPPAANAANAAKSLDPQGFARGEDVAKDGESPARHADPSPAIRHFSPAVRHAASLAPQGFSQDSPLSPGASVANHAPLADGDVEVF